MATVAIGERGPAIPEFDAVIVGQGLAGTALAWQLRWRGTRFQILERGDPVTPSKIAAGLITPVTGKRLAVDSQFDQYYSTAADFYRRVEAETGERFFHQTGAVRILRDPDEVQRLDRKRNAELRGRIGDVTINESIFDAPLGSFAIPAAARLDVNRYLDASRRMFEADGSFRRDDYFQSPPPARQVIFSTGIAAFREQTLPPELFQPAKGEILTLRIPGLAEDRVIHRGVWLARIADDLYRAGATYSWDDLDDAPTAAGRRHLERRVKEFLKLPFEVVGHDAAVRPITVDRQPLLREVSPNVWHFNGLGSKGALLAPWFSQLLASGEPSVSPTRQNQNPANDTTRWPRLTEKAHELLGGQLKPGDIAIDATAGNGRDTLLLASCVGPTGKVFAFDIQPRAIQLTSQRLAEAGISNTQLVCFNHAELEQLIPKEHHGRVAAISFNLGFLPGGDKTIVTTIDSTIQALRSALKILKTGGLLTVMTYVGHAGGEEEDQLVRETLGDCERIIGSKVGPRLYVVRK